MGNKFKFSDMIPNAWFHKLKDMSKSRKKKSNNINSPKNIKKKPSLSPPTITTKTTLNNSNSNSSKPQYEQPPQEPPRKSSKRRSTSSSSSSRRRKPVFKPAHSRFVSSPSESENDEAFLRLSSSTADIIIDLETYEVKRAQNKIDHNNVSVDLPPILTKPINFDDTIFEATKDSRSLTKTTARNSGNSSSTSSTTKSLSVKIVKEERTVQRQKTTRYGNESHQQKRSSSSSSTAAAGIRLRANSPRLARKSVSSWSRNRRYLSESSAVVKSSVDPQRDFRDSMVEMIVENNIRASKDLEDLLACYLSLNVKEYHDVIVKAFEQIWFDMADIRI